MYPISVGLPLGMPMGTNSNNGLMPVTAKYSAGYLQRQNMFSSRKENNGNFGNYYVNGSNKVGNNGSQANISNVIANDKVVLGNKNNNSKNKKN